MVEINLDDPWVRREDNEHKRRDRGDGKCQQISLICYLAIKCSELLFYRSCYGRADNSARM